jgi:hypothetical protein
MKSTPLLCSLQIEMGSVRKHFVSIATYSHAGWTEVHKTLKIFLEQAVRLSAQRSVKKENCEL